MWYVPAGCGGDVAVIDVPEFTVKLAAGTLPNITEVAPVKLLPVMLTLIPPAVVPLLPVKLLIAGVLAAV
jgi:hypothetical protein